MKNLMKFAIFSLILSAVLGFSVIPAKAYYGGTPYLTATNQGSFTQISVSNANPYSLVNLYEQQQNSSLWTVINNLGTTDGNGYFTQQISMGAMTAYVVVGGAQSNTVTVNSYNNGGGCGVYPYNNYNCGGCTYNCGTGITLSPSTVSLAAGQNATVNIQNNYSGSAYISNNSNQSVVTATVSGNIVTLYGLTAGSTTLNICTNSYSQCASLFVTVTGSYGYGNGSVTFSQNNLSLTINQNTTVYVYGSNTGSNYFYVSGNTNNNSVIANLSGNVLSMTGYNAGTSSITVCQSNGGCGTLNITVGGGSGYGTGTVTFSQNNPVINAGQTTTVIIYGNAPFYISSNASQNIVSATVSGNVLTLIGNAAGTANVSVCSTNYGYNNYGGTGCGSLYVTVNGYNNGGGYGYGNVTLSQTNVTVAQGQTISVSVYGNGPFYLSSASSNIASGVMSGNTLSIYGSNPGTATITVCQSNNSYGCASVVVTVTGYGCTYNCGGSGVLGASVYANGQLISVNGTVYMVYRNTLTAFANASAFLGLGYNFSSVYPVNYPSGMTISNYVISSAYAAHPWGAWIKSGPTVYFVSQYGLIPVPDWNTFLNNGGQANLVVNANSWDFQQPMLSPMVYSDARLR